MFLPGISIDDDDDDLSTGAVVAITAVVTLVITLVVTSLISIFITRMYYQRQIKELASTNNVINTKENSQFVQMGQDIKMDSNPAYAVMERDTIKMDSNPAYAVAT